MHQKNTTTKHLKTNNIMETLEEAAEKYNLNTINAFGDYESFIAGAKFCANTP